MWIEINDFCFVLFVYYHKQNYFSQPKNSMSCSEIQITAIITRFSTPRCSTAVEQETSELSETWFKHLAGLDDILILNFRYGEPSNTATATRERSFWKQNSTAECGLCISHSVINSISLCSKPCFFCSIKNPRSHSRADKCRQVQTSGDKCRQVQTTTEKCRQVQTTSDNYRQLHISADKCRHLQTTADSCRQVQTSADNCRQLQTAAGKCS